MPIVPRTISGHNDWINRTDDRLQAVNPDTTNPYWTDFGLTKAVADDWHLRRQNWLKLYLTHGGRHDSVDNKNLQDAIASMATFAEKPLLTIAGSSIVTNDDAFIFNFKIGHADPSQTHAAITSQVAARILMEGRGRVDIICTRAEDQNRASKAAGADGIQFGKGVINQPAPGDTHTDLSSITIDNALIQKDISTHAHFHLDLGMGSVGKWLVVYFRWYNTKHPELAGPWSVVQIAMIS